MWCTVIAFAAVGWSGCGGGGSRLSAPRYARAASRICAAANHDIARIGVTSLADERSAAKAVGRIVVIQRDSISELRDLKPPQQLSSLNQQWIALLDQGTDELEQIRVSLGSSKAKLAQDYAAEATVLFERAGVLVREHGMTSCRGPRLP